MVQNFHGELVKTPEFRYGSQHLCDVYCAKLRVGSISCLPHIERNMDRIIRLVYPEVQEGFRMEFAAEIFTDVLETVRAANVTKGKQDVYKRQE